MILVRAACAQWRARSGQGRIDLGAARLIYAGLVIASISTGLLLGLALLVSIFLWTDQPAVPQWLDMIAAGIAVFAYSVFFSTPLHISLGQWGLACWLMQ